jgi:hypothetical protein
LAFLRFVVLKRERLFLLAMRDRRLRAKCEPNGKV